MQATIRDLNGDDAGSIDLPEVFETAYRPDLIKRAVIAAQANRKQPYGADPYARLRTPAESMGSGRGMSHDPRQNGVARRVPHAVSGRRAHPPKAEKDQGKEINTKERKLAVRSALAATTDPELVAERGHRFDDDVELPSSSPTTSRTSSRRRRSSTSCSRSASPTTSSAPRRTRRSRAARASSAVASTPVRSPSSS